MGTDAAIETTTTERKKSRKKSPNKWPADEQNKKKHRRRRLSHKITYIVHNMGRLAPRRPVRDF